MSSNENGVALELRLDAVGPVGDCIHAETIVDMAANASGQTTAEKGNERLVHPQQSFRRPTRSRASQFYPWPCPSPFISDYVVAFML
jgi:hypothetical protein